MHSPIDLFYELQDLHDSLKSNIRNIQELSFRFLQEHGLFNNKEAIDKIDTELDKINESLQKIYSISVNTHNIANIPDLTYLNYYFFDQEQIKALRKLETNFLQDVDVKFLLNINFIELRSMKGFGSKTIESLRNIISLVRIELAKNVYELDQHDLKRNILIPVKEYQFNLKDLENVILEDIEEYLLTLNEQEIDIAMKRWGFHHDQESLEEISLLYKTSRERIRQIETIINNRLTRYLRIHPIIMWSNFKDHLSPELPLKIKTLASCFSTPESLYQFLEICFNLEKGTIKYFIIPDVNRNILEKYFTQFSSPVSHEDLSNWLISETVTENNALAANYISQLEEYGIIQNTSDGFIPKSLNQKNAVAHVLTKHPNGLPWQDIIRIINTNKYTKQEIFDRIMPGQMFDNEYVYLSDRGTYRHVKYANFDGIDFEEIFLDILYFFDDSNEKSLHLYTDYFQQRKDYINVDYYSLRYIVKNYGEKHGVYFLGQSHVDTVSLHPNPDRVTLKDAILNVLKNSETSLTIAEIAQETRSRNQILTFYTIQDLQQEDKIVRVDQKLYTTPEKAFQTIDQENVLIEIDRIIQTTHRIIECDVFCEQINQTFNYSFSKHFYASLASLNQKRFAWYCKNQFFCKQPFIYKSMSEIMNKTCKIEIEQKENIIEVQKIIWLTQRTASSAYYNWKFKEQFIKTHQINNEIVASDNAL